MSDIFKNLSATAIEVLRRSKLDLGVVEALKHISEGNYLKAHRVNKSDLIILVEYLLQILQWKVDASPAETIKKSKTKGHVTSETGKGSEKLNVPEESSSTKDCLQIDKDKVVDVQKCFDIAIGELFAEERESRSIFETPVLDSSDKLEEECLSDTCDVSTKKNETESGGDKVCSLQDVTNDNFVPELVEVDVKKTYTAEATFETNDLRDLQKETEDDNCEATETGEGESSCDTGFDKGGYTRTTDFIDNKTPERLRSVQSKVDHETNVSKKSKDLTENPVPCTGVDLDEVDTELDNQMVESVSCETQIKGIEKSNDIGLKGEKTEVFEAEEEGETAKLLERMNSKLRPFKCEKCKRKFAKLDDLESHNKRHHSLLKFFKCKICDKRFKRSGQLRRHERDVHLGEKRFACPKCDLKVSSKAALLNHDLIHTGEKPFKCSYCDKRFRVKKFLLDHERIHTGEKPFKCPHCGKAYRTKNVLWSHQFLHTGEKPYGCSKCESRFTTRNSQINHEKQAHSCERPFECTQCGKRFKIKSALKRHDLTHKKKKSLQCSECLMFFSRTDHLQRHKNSETACGTNDPQNRRKFEDCESCLHCLDKVKNGGSGKLRRPCMRKIKANNSTQNGISNLNPGNKNCFQNPAAATHDVFLGAPNGISSHLNANEKIEKKPKRSSVIVPQDRKKFEDCKSCRNCLDKEKYGGLGTWKKACIQKPKVIKVTLTQPIEKNCGTPNSNCNPGDKKWFLNPAVKAHDVSLDAPNGMLYLIEENTEIKVENEPETGSIKRLSLGTSIVRRDFDLGHVISARTKEEKQDLTPSLKPACKEMNALGSTAPITVDGQDLQRNPSVETSVRASEDENTQTTSLIDEEKSVACFNMDTSKIENTNERNSFSETPKSLFESPFLTGTPKTTSEIGGNLHLDKFKEEPFEKHLKPFECSICRDRFTLKHKLEKHVAYLHKERRYTMSQLCQNKCRNCGKIFFEANSFNIHRKWCGKSLPKPNLDQTKKLNF